MLCGRAIVCVRRLVLLHSHGAMDGSYDSIGSGCHGSKGSSLYGTKGSATDGISYSATDGSYDHIGSGCHGSKGSSLFGTQGSSPYNPKECSPYDPKVEYSGYNSKSYDGHTGSVSHSTEVIIVIIDGTLTFCKEMKGAGGLVVVSMCFGCLCVFLRFCVFTFLFLNFVSKKWFRRRCGLVLRRDLVALSLVSL